MSRISDWKESAEESYAQNLKKAVENSEFSFEVTEEQKEHLEENHFVELDGWFSCHFGFVPHTYRFEKFWNGTEDVYTCEAYWND